MNHIEAELLAEDWLHLIERSAVGMTDPVELMALADERVEAETILALARARVDEEQRRAAVTTLMAANYDGISARECPGQDR
jgi:hypothetical protein